MNESLTPSNLQLRAAGSSVSFPSFSFFTAGPSKRIRWAQTVPYPSFCLAGRKFAILLGDVAAGNRKPSLASERSGHRKMQCPAESPSEALMGVVRSPWY